MGRCPFARLAFAWRQQEVRVCTHGARNGSACMNPRRGECKSPGGLPILLPEERRAYALNDVEAR